jgi:ABC-type Na+ efflux pump permease subunit
MKRIKQTILMLAMVLGIGLLAPVSVGAVNVIGDQCADNPDSAICGDQNADPAVLIKTIVNVLLFIIGLISVIMIIVGGFMYTTSAGDSGQVTKAKNTILFAVVGLVVAFLAFAIVNYVVNLF